MTSVFLILPAAVATAAWAPAPPVRPSGSARVRLSLAQGLAAGPPGSPVAARARGHHLAASPRVRTKRKARHQPSLIVIAANNSGGHRLVCRSLIVLLSVPGGER